MACWRIEKRDAAQAGREEPEPDRVILFGEKEGRIARANRGKDGEPADSSAPVEGTDDNAKEVEEETTERMPF